MEKYDRKFHLKWFVINVAIFWVLLIQLKLLSPLGLPYLLEWPVHTFLHLGIDSTLSYYYKEKKGIRFIKLLLLGILYDIGFYVYTAFLIVEFIAYKLSLYEITLHPAFRNIYLISLVAGIIVQLGFGFYRFYHFLKGR
jgi:hypothetical protein